MMDERDDLPHDLPHDVPPDLPHSVDALLASGLLQVPDGFAERVMRQVWTLPMPARPRPPLRRYLKRWQMALHWLALAGAGLLGAVQLLGFAFGMWAAMGAA